MTLSVVVPTKNEEANIVACLGAFRDFPDIELIVVDNHSPDRTRDLAAAAGAKVIVQGPERCAQRNAGWRAAHGDWVMFVDADMIVPKETVEEILGRLSAAGRDEKELAAAGRGDLALYVREVRTGGGLRIRARNFERSFYDGTEIDGLRVLPRRALETVGGYDESLVACEDWDLDRRLLAAGVRTAITDGPLLHNESRQTLRVLLGKKAYYSKSVDRYRDKWRNDAVCRRQFGLGYRFFGVFIRRGGWRRLLRHPILAAVLYAERIAVGAVYLIGRQAFKRSAACLLALLGASAFGGTYDGYIRYTGSGTASASDNGACWDDGGNPPGSGKSYYIGKDYYYGWNGETGKTFKCDR